MRAGVALVLFVLLAPAGATGSLTASTTASTTRSALLTFSVAKPICKPPQMCPVAVVPKPRFTSACYSSTGGTTWGQRVSRLSPTRWKLAGHLTSGALSVAWAGTYRATNGSYSGAGTGTWHATHLPASCGAAPSTGSLTIAWTKGANAGLAVAHLRLLGF